MAHAGQELQGRDGFRLRIVALSDELLEMEATYSGEGAMPPEHFHPHQAEHFEVLEGAMRATIDGAEHRYAAGDAFDVPVGTPHTMAGDGHARVRWEVRPALRTAEFFDRIYGDGPPPGEGFMEEFSAEFRLTVT